MGTSRIALGAVFGTINEAATSVSSLFGTATKSINMLNKYVSDVSERQALRSIVDTHSYKKSLIEEKTMETAMRKLEVKSFCAQPPNGACIASQAVFAGAPVLVVTHYQDDHSWAFTDGGPNDPAKAMVVAMSEVLEACPDIGQVADLPPGWSARRTSTGQPWSRHPDADESSD